MKRAGLWLAAVIAALFVLGFALFVVRAADAQDPRVTADGIVVLTGGEGRVQAGLRLLADGRAPRLLISGVGRTTDYHTLARLDGAQPGLSQQVTLGYKARTTRGNAREAAAWVHEKGLHSLIVVTAFYHMPRAVAELSRAIPGIVLHPYPVHPASLHPWWRKGAAWRLLALEYVKYLAVVSGVAPLVRHTR